MASQTNTVTFTILRTDVARYRDRVAKVAKRAVKLGCAAPTLTVKREWVHRASVETYHPESQNPRKVDHRVVDITVTRPAVVIPGFDIVGVVEYPIAGNDACIVTSTTGDEIDPKWRGVRRCDHCGKHRNRTHIFLLRSEDGEVMPVGRSCLKDYTGHDVSLARVRFAWGDMDEWFRGGRTDPWTWSLGGVLTKAAAFTLQHGYVKTSAGEASTASNVALALAGDRCEVEFEVTDEAHKLAADTLEWLQSLDDVRGDYMLNLKTAFMLGATTRKTFGLVCSAVSAFQRHQQRELETARRTAEVSEQGDRYLGPVGSKIHTKKLTKKDRDAGVERLDAVEATFTGAKTFFGQFGETTYVRFVTDDGVRLAWKASNDCWYDADGDVHHQWNVGARFRIERGTVKAHRPSKGQWASETTLVRCKVYAV